MRRSDYLNNKIELLLFRLHCFSLSCLVDGVPGRNRAPDISRCPRSRANRLFVLSAACFQKQRHGILADGGCAHLMACKEGKFPFGNLEGFPESVVTAAFAMFGVHDIAPVKENGAREGLGANTLRVKFESAGFCGSDEQLHHVNNAAVVKLALYVRPGSPGGRNGGRLCLLRPDFYAVHVFLHAKKVVIMKIALRD
jgi:hypothetical protein